MVDMLILAVVTVYVIDLSGIVDSIKSGLGRWLGVKVGRLRPIDCSLCMVWWVCLIYTLCAGMFDLPHILWAAVLSFLSSVIGDALQLVRECLRYVIGKLYKLIDE